MARLLSLFLLFLVLPLGSAQAQSIIRDTEIETILTRWFTPIFQANDMDPAQVKIILVQNNDVNAFVAGGSNIFFFTGLIEKTDNPGELIGVMAHELGHISGGHLIRGRKALEQASYENLLGTILGVGTAIATGDAGAAAAGSAASNSVATRRFLSTARQFESSADQAAIASLNKAGLNPTGLLTFMQKLEGQELLQTSQQSEYVRTHPLTRNRIETIQAAVDDSPYKDTPLPDGWMADHARMKAKLTGFINPEQVTWLYDDRDQSLPAVYARAIADYRESRIDSALNHINELLKREPENPYFHELKGQMLVDFGQVQEALPSYHRALELAPQSGLIRTALAHAQIETAGNDAAKLNQAITNLKRAARDEPRSPRIHRLLATAYGRLNEEGLVHLHLAEEALLQRRIKESQTQAELAKAKLPPESTSALRAHDIILILAKEKQE